MLVTARQWLQFAVSLLLGSVILYWVFQGQDWGEMWHTLKRARFGWIGLSSLAGLIAHALRGYRWTLLAGAVGPKPATIDAYHSVMVGYLANLALPRVGEVARCGALSRKSGLPMNSLIGTVIVERAVDVLVLLVVVVMTLLLYSSLLLGPAQRLLMRLGGGSTLWILGVTGLGFGLMAYLLWLNRLQWLERLRRGSGDKNCWVCCGACGWAYGPFAVCLIPVFFGYPHWAFGWGTFSCPISACLPLKAPKIWGFRRPSWCWLQAVSGS